MKLGVLQQYGTPDEIYNDPANAFVAGFIGDPPMNLLRVKVVEDASYTYAFELGDGSLLRVPEIFYRVIHTGDVFDLGIRPTSITIVEGEEYDARFKVDLFEFLGEERSVGIQINESLLNIVYNDNRRFAEGDIIHIRVNPDLLFLFEPESGERVRPR